MKSDIIYHDETLYVILEGIAAVQDLKNLKHKMDYIINEYGISNIVFDTTNLINEDNYYFDIFSDYSNVRIKKM